MNKINALFEEEDYSENAMHRSLTDMAAVFTEKVAEIDMLP